MIAALVLGALVGLGLVVSWRLLFPPPPPLQAAIDRLNRRNELVGITDRGARDAQVGDLRGALVADLAWRDAQMQCDGDLRPDGGGLRITLAGPLDADRQVRFIIGIDLADTDDGPAQVLPTNLTVLVENEAVLFATRGNDRCAVEDLARIVIGQGIERVSARGYCLGPASDLNGEQRVLVPTFSFTALARTTLPDEEGG